MANKLFLIFVLFLSGKVRFGIADQQCIDSLKQANITQDIVKSCGTTDLEVSYPGILGSSNIKCGDSIPIGRTALPPTLKLDIVQKCTKVNYFQKDPRVELFLIDPDFKNIDEGDSFVLWRVRNINGTDLKNGFHQGSSGDTSQTYLPPSNAGNRYIFLLYCQPSEDKEVGQFSLDDRYQLRRNFNPKKFQRADYKGDPDACFFFKSRLV